MRRSEQEKANWFFKQFGERVSEEFKDTNIPPALVGAIALQETGYLWNGFWKAGADTEEEFLSLCVGDTVSNRSYFPRNHSELISAPRGTAAFRALRKALEEVAETRHRFRRYADGKYNILYGYGIFQYDILFYKEFSDYDFFIKHEWKDFNECLRRLKKVMLQNMRRRNFSTTDDLSHEGQIKAALLYHRGKIKANKPIREQGWCENDGKGPCYGAKIDRYLRICRRAINELNEDVSFDNQRQVTARSGLNLRTGPGIEFDVLLTIPNGEPVIVISDGGSSQWVQVDLEGDGKIDGYVHAGFLA
jgi:hypothetical protein